jgi:predicted transcriptional regulator
VFLCRKDGAVLNGVRATTALSLNSLAVGVSRACKEPHEYVRTYESQEVGVVTLRNRIKPSEEATLLSVTCTPALAGRRNHGVL